MDGFLPERGNKRQLNVLGNELEPCNFISPTLLNRSNDVQ